MPVPQRAGRPHHIRPPSGDFHGFRVPRAAERNALAKVAAEIKHQLQGAKS